MLVSVCYAQSTVDYLFSLETNNFESFYSLKIDEDISLWSEVKKMKVKKNSYNYNVSYLEDENYALKQVYKNFKDSTMLSNIKVISKNYFISEKTNTLKWEMLDSTETILNYECQLAKADYKGRTYLASFTSKIPNNSGPWKFHGLPGMILKVVSTDNNEFYKMECVEIKEGKSLDSEAIYSQFLLSKSFLSWDEFVVDVNKMINNYMRSVKSKESISDDAQGDYFRFRLTNYLEVFNKEVQSFGAIID